MKLSVRTTKTASGKTAVQVINYFKRKVNVIKHIGSTDNPDTLDSLKQQGKGDGDKGKGDEGKGW